MGFKKVFVRVGRVQQLQCHVVMVKTTWGDVDAVDNQSWNVRRNQGPKLLETCCRGGHVQHTGAAEHFGVRPRRTVAEIYSRSAGYRMQSKATVETYS